MGKGDTRTAKGKRFRKSFGNSRPKPKKKAAIRADKNKETSTTTKKKSRV